jgi:phytol kinase
VTIHPLVVVGLASLAFGLALSALVAEMAERPGGPGLLSRKVFHVAVFTGAVPAHLLQGFWGVVTYGTVLALLVIMANWQGSGSGLFRALARAGGHETPRGEILAPLTSTAVGGLLSALLVGNLAVVGYLVCGWGDAVGEPVGRRLGRRRYRSPLARRDSHTRSLEGSAAVFVVGSGAATVALILQGFSTPESLWTGVLCGAAGAVAEGLSGPGTDNLWVQLVPSLSAWWLLG